MPFSLNNSKLKSGTCKLVRSTTTTQAFQSQPALIEVEGPYLAGKVAPSAAAWISIVRARSADV